MTRRMLGLGAVLLGVLLGAGCKPSVSVPDVGGMTQAAATAAIVGAKLVAGITTNMPSATVALGCVISQDPTAGTKVAKSAAVDLVISSGVSVPDVGGMTQAEADSRLVAVNLVLGVVTDAPSATVPAGVIISQNPIAGTNVTPGTAVNLVISTGRQPAVAWHFTAAPQSSWGTTVEKTSDGGFIVGGGYNGAYDMYALKLNATGGKAWDQHYSNRTPDANNTELWRHEARGACQTPEDGGYVVLGAGRNLVDPNPDQSFLLLKTDASGEIEWSKSYAPENPYGDPGEPAINIMPAALQVTAPDGGYVAFGSCYVGLYNLACILKTDEHGEVEFCKVINDNARAYEQIIEGGQQTADGGYVLVGRSSNGAPHGYMALIIKVDAEGDWQWSKTFQYTAKDYGAEAYAISQLADGGYVIGGLLVNNITKVSTHGFWMARLNASGNEVWSHDYADQDIISYCNALAETPDGDILAVGGSHIGQMTLAKFSAAGAFLWDFNDESLPEAAGNDLVLTDDGGCVVVGSAGTGGSTLIMKVNDVYDPD